MTRLTSTDYTVGWICALAEPELRVSRALLDGPEHEAPWLPAIDPHPFTFGKINGHNVVMACFPSGTMGTDAAASTAEAMRGTFANLKYALLVGIGGGAPSDAHDIRLGDVVVGHPHASTRTSGVVRYDFGKATHEGFQITGTQDRPSRHLLEAVSQVKGAGVDGGRFLQYVRNVNEAVAALETTTPGPRVDKLFLPHYTHSQGKSDCTECLSQFEVGRRARGSTQPVVHYGTIASGNQVMKDAQKRDAIKQEHPDIKCFEMEAGGVSNVLPCLVVRGICDYCDSHKNDHWQPYAAGVAAAFAKELLRRMPVLSCGEPSVSSTRQPHLAHVPKVVNMLPFDPDPDFVGREHILEKITALFKANERKMLSRVALWGLGGLGKSQIAIEYGSRVSQRQQRRSVLWIYASTEGRFIDSYARIAKALELPGHDDPTFDHVQKTYEYLCSATSGMWLLILDNADDVGLTSTESSTETGRSGFSITKYLPQKSGCNVLITSRDKQAAMNLIFTDSKCLIEVPEMSVAETVLLFQKKTTSDHHDPVRMNRLAEQLDCIPLAITQAAAFISCQERMNIPRYLERFQATSRIKSVLVDYDMPDARRDLNVPNAVFQTWQVSFSRIEAKDEEAARLQYAIAFLDRHGIPEQVLHQLPKAEQGSVDSAIDMLLRFRFIRQMRGSSTELRLYETHRLIQLATKHWMSLHERTESSAFEAIEMVNSQYGDDGREGWAMCRMLEPHADSVTSALVDLWATQGPSSGPIQQAYVRYRQRNLGEWLRVFFKTKRRRGDLAYKRGVYAYQQGKYDHALSMGRLARQDLTQAIHSHHGLTLACGALIVRSCLNANDPTALTEGMGVGELTVRRQSRELGAEHEGTLTTRSHLAMLYYRVGRVEEAQETLSSVIKAFQSMSPAQLARGDACRSLVMAMNDLSTVSGDRGRLEEARGLQSSALAILESSYGSQNLEVLNLKANLARSLFDLGQRREGTEMLELVVATKSMILEPGHYERTSSTHALALCYWHQFRLEEAEQLMRTVVHDSKAALGESHELTLSRMSQLVAIQSDRAMHSLHV